MAPLLYTKIVETDADYQARFRCFLNGTATALERNKSAVRMLAVGGSVGGSGGTGTGTADRPLSTIRSFLKPVDDTRFQVRMDFCHSGTEHCWVEALWAGSFALRPRPGYGPLPREPNPSSSTASLVSCPIQSIHDLRNFFTDNPFLAYETNPDGLYLSEIQLRAFYRENLRALCTYGRACGGARCGVLPGDTVHYVDLFPYRVMTRSEICTPAELEEREFDRFLSGGAEAHRREFPVPPPRPSQSGSSYSRALAAAGGAGRTASFSFDEMKVVELKAMLRSSKLKVSGNKAELVARLEESLAAVNVPPHVSSTDY